MIGKEAEMGYPTWMTAATGRLSPTDLALVKWSCIAFGVLLAQRFSGVRQLDERLVGAAVVALAIKPAVSALGAR
ncbi:hypothetical protein PCC79_12145 [Propioniciclava soli]|uniref:Uncharacterized protein n=2 Tax=Propioniciclava soli TaxID=2775081 RepID=A0ABZ3C5V0_9ACTN